MYSLLFCILVKYHTNFHLKWFSSLPTLPTTFDFIMNLICLVVKFQMYSLLFCILVIYHTNKIKFKRLNQMFLLINENKKQTRDQSLVAGSFV